MSQRFTWLVGAACALGAWPAHADEAPAADWPALRQTIRSDPPPAEITRGLHYVISDERRHDLFLPHIQGRGGLYIGVGANQNYVLAAWARADAMIIIDFDQVIIDLHQVYAVALRQAESPEAFLALWGRSREARLQLRDLILAAHPPGAVRRGALQALKAYRGNVVWGFEQMRQRFAEQNVKTFLDDAEQYAALRQIFLDDRVLFVRGDFTGRRTLADVAHAVTTMGWPLRLLYLSNIEQYFPWGRGQYRENMLALPVSNDTVVIRAYGFGRFGTADHNYRYYVQSGDSFRSWLGDAGTRSVRRMLVAQERTEVKGFYRIERAPSEVPPRRQRPARSESQNDETDDSSGSEVAGGSS